MDLRIITTDAAPQAIGPYSQAITAGGVVYCAGQIALDPKSGQVVEGDIKVQTGRVLDSLRAVLEAAGSDLAHVLKTTVFIVSFDDFAAMNEVYGEKFGTHRPARSTVTVAGLPRGVRVEIECIAAQVRAA